MKTIKHLEILCHHPKFVDPKNDLPEILHEPNVSHKTIPNSYKENIFFVINLINLSIFFHNEEKRKQIEVIKNNILAEYQQYSWGQQLGSFILMAEYAKQEILFIPHEIQKKHPQHIIQIFSIAKSNNFVNLKKSIDILLPETKSNNFLFNCYASKILLGNTYTEFFGKQMDNKKFIMEFINYIPDSGIYFFYNHLNDNLKSDIEISNIIFDISPHTLLTAPPIIFEDQQLLTKILTKNGGYYDVLPNHLKDNIDNLLLSINTFPDAINVAPEHLMIKPEVIQAFCQSYINNVDNFSLDEDEIYDSFCCCISKILDKASYDIDCLSYSNINDFLKNFIICSDKKEVAIAIDNISLPTNKNKTKI